MNPKDVVFKVFIKNDDGTLNEDVVIYRDGTWESVYIPRDRRTMLLHDLHQRVRASVLEDYKKNVKENWHSDAALPPFVSAHKEDKDAYTTLCGVCGQPHSLNLNDCIEHYAVQYFGEGDPWKENELWNRVVSGEIMI